MKKHTINVLLVTAIFLTASLCTAQTVSLDVNGIEIGTKYETVIEKLGKPRSKKKGGTVPCNEGNAVRTLRYPGLVLKFDSEHFGLFEVKVMSKKWLVYGLRIGANKTLVIEKLGPGRELEDNGKSFLGYFVGDGYGRFYFKNDRLTKVIWWYTFC